MGLFNRNKKDDKPKWFVNKKRGDVELEENYIKLTTKITNIEHIVFYKDIHDIKKGKRCIRIKSKTETYTMSIVSNGESIIDEVYVQLLEKIGE